MKMERTYHGFPLLTHPAYVVEDEDHPEPRLAQMSSVVGEYADAFARPGSSALWIGQDHHLNREEVAELVKHLKAWLETGTLEVLTPGA